MYLVYVKEKYLPSDPDFCWEVLVAVVRVLPVDGALDLDLETVMCRWRV